MQSRIVKCIVSWPLYRDTYRIVTLLVIHSTSSGKLAASSLVEEKCEFFLDVDMKE